ncbi:Asp-tRNA(Asn)/Glu-tRNA(Gln) amidotransferase GatCAB subunit A [Methylobacterium terrae]|uniref:Indoleacetamide hydrolase n=1 Tax=Methylobacterium terrae TaxID=2202827 RepID=A0A2U8WMM1_9HYPH|nr:amidase [Methylobacterium terrae]AWN47505.1 Asp-tRNA(Asn)/Glu-tRNA(Gln) amidotransferase GatCAB subunit A [Methylobacterium terrae]
MAITRPSAAQVRELAAGLYMSLSPEEAAAYRALMDASFDAYDVIDALPDYIPEVKYPRTPGRRPGPEENPLGAWYWKSEVKGAGHGKLAGKRVALKDNVALAGVPMMNGASTLEGFVPAADATIVTRMLDEGATILGKATCEHFCLSGGSHTSDPGPVHNPHRRGYSAGGSSSGSGALVAAGEVDLAIGGDQGGSIRIPAAYCGIVGMKPTHGLVPYTGVMPIETTIDHTGPMTARVADNALLLEVLAGPDGLDPRQVAPQVAPYAEALGRGAKGLRIGLLTEGFAAPGMQEAVAEKVRAGAARFERLGARVEEVSLPAYRLAASVWQPIALEGLTQQMMLGNGMGFNWKGAYDVGLFDAHAGWRGRADDLSATLKISMLIGQWGLTHYRGRYYAKAQNLARQVRKDFSETFRTYDLLLCPTLPCIATKLPEPGAPLEEVIVRAFEMVASTSPMDVTGNPSLSLPCGLVDGLPVGLMLTARDWNESAIYQAAAAFEADGDWRGF